jgi:eukaryotic-like serine/threonine-protein kinase
MAVTRMLADRYRLEERLGGGGMSIVWRAYDEVLDRWVAVKVVSPRHENEALARARIRTEARAATRLDHPHVTKVLDYSYAVGVPYLVMELLEGQTLAARMRAGRLPAPAALEACAQVADALAAAHASGVVHRDMKPGNVMLTSTGAKVLDFGIAAFVDESDELGRSTGPAGWVSDSIWGTAAYVAPERLTHNRVLPASDVYALGILLYEALTGQRPWPAAGRAELLAAHVSADPALLPADAGVPPEVAALCGRCLAKDPGERPTAREVATVLAAAVRAGAVRAAVRAAVGAVPAMAGAATALIRPRFRRHAATGFGDRLRRRWAVLAASAGIVAALATVLSFCAMTDQSRRQVGPEAAPPPPQPGTSQPQAGPTGSSPPGAGPQAPTTAPGGGSGTPGIPGQAEGQPGAGSAPGGSGGGTGSGAGLGLGSGSGSSSGSGSGPAGTGNGRGGGDGGGTTPSPNPEPSPTPTPAPSPTPSPTTTSPRPPNAVTAIERTLSTLGGVVVTRCEGRRATLVSWHAEPGYQVAEVSQGPGVRVGIVFRDLLDEIKLTVHCESGVPAAAIAG